MGGHLPTFLLQRYSVSQRWKWQTCAKKYKNVPAGIAPPQ